MMLAGLLVGLLLWVNGGAFQDVHAVAPPTSSDSARGWRLLLGLPVIMGFLFFVGISLTGRGLSSFGVSALTLEGVSLSGASAVISAFLFAAPVTVFWAVACMSLVTLFTVLETGRQRR